MKDTEDYELYDKNFDEWRRLGLEAFGLMDHPGAINYETRKGSDKRGEIF